MGNVLITIRRPHGVHGEVKITSTWPVNQPPTPGQTFILSRMVEDGLEQLTFRQQRGHKDRLIAKFDELTSPEQAKLYNGLTLRMPGSASTTSGEAVATQLLGFTVLDEHGTSIGKVTQIDNFGAQDILEVTAQTQKIVQLPYIPDAVVKVDQAAKEIVVSASYIL